MLTEHQRRFFQRKGYLPLGRVSLPAEVERLKRELSVLLGEVDGTSPGSMPEDHLMRSEAGPAGESAGHVRVALHLCHLSEPFRDRALDQRVASAVGDILEEEPVVLTSLLFNKPPYVGEALSLHQDLPYYPYLGEDDLATCWVALDDVGLDNGCVEYLPGSHRARVPHRETGLQQALGIDPATVDASSAVAVSLMAGEAVLHHGLTVHRSSANRSGRPRMGLATLYIRQSATVTPEDFPYPVLAPLAGVTTQQNRG